MDPAKLEDVSNSNMPSFFSSSSSVAAPSAGSVNQRAEDILQAIPAFNLLMITPTPASVALVPTLFRGLFGANDVIVRESYLASEARCKLLLTTHDLAFPRPIDTEWCPLIDTSDLSLQQPHLYYYGNLWLHCQGVHPEPAGGATGELRPRRMVPARIIGHVGRVGRVGWVPHEGGDLVSPLPLDLFFFLTTSRG